MIGKVCRVFYFHLHENLWLPAYLVCRAIKIHPQSSAEKGPWRQAGLAQTACIAQHMYVYVCMLRVYVCRTL